MKSDASRHVAVVSPPRWGIAWFDGTQSHREAMERLRGIHRNDGVGLLQAIHQGCAQWPPGRQRIVSAPGAHPLPPQAVAAQRGPDRWQQSPTTLLGLVHPQRQHHDQGTPHSEMVRALPSMVRQVIALVLQRSARLIGPLPSRSPTSAWRTECVPCRRASLHAPRPARCQRRAAQAT